MFVVGTWRAVRRLCVCSGGMEGSEETVCVCSGDMEGSEETVCL